MQTDEPSPPFDRATLASGLVQFLRTRERGTDAYLDAKTTLLAGPAEVLRAYARIREELRSDQRILDWGCRHGVWSHLVRADFGATMQLDGCDICAPDEYADFHAASDLRYRQITHPWRLDYADHSFDAVVAGGTLEHVPNDGESLTELWRILKPDGVLLITHLPNRGSWTEWLSRRLFPQQAHARLYDLRDTRRRLLQHGFEPLRWGHHQIVPASLPAHWLRRRAVARAVDALQGLNRLERVWPLRRLSATLWIVARRRNGF